jgi:hypothetical protein
MIKTYMLAAGIDGGSGYGWGALVDGVDQPVATRTDGWNPGTIASVPAAANFATAQIVPSGVFDVPSGYPSLSPGGTNIGGTGFKSPLPLSGTFAATAWTITLAVRAVNNASGQNGRVRARVYKSANANGSANTQLTSAVQLGSNSGALTTSADGISTATWTPAAPFTLNNEYLFFIIAWETASPYATNTAADVMPRTGQAASGTRIVTSDFKAAGPYPNVVLADAPYAYYRLDELSGTTAFDSSGNGLDATYAFGPTLGQSGSPVVSGKSISCDGVDDIVNWPAGFSIPAGSSITLEWWQYIASADVSTPSTFWIGGADDLNNRINVHAPWSDQNLYWDYGNINTVGRISTSFAAQLNKWTLIQLTYDAATGTRAISFDGVQAVSAVGASAPGITLSAGHFGGAGFKGLADEIAVYLTALTPTQRLAHYNMRAAQVYGKGGYASSPMVGSGPKGVEHNRSGGGAAGGVGSGAKVYVTAPPVVIGFVGPFGSYGNSAYGQEEYGGTPQVRGVQLVPVWDKTGYGAAGGVGAGSLDNEILDLFNRADQDPIAGNWRWPVQPGDSPMKIASGLFRSNAGGGLYASAYWSANIFAANSWVTGKVASLATNDRMELYVRLTNPGTSSVCGYMLKIDDNLFASGQTGWRLFRLDNNSETYISGGGTPGGDQFQAIAVGGTVKLQAIGSTITAWYQAPGSNAWQLVQTVTDGIYPTAGLNGLGSAFGGAWSEFGGARTVAALSVKTGFATAGGVGAGPELRSATTAKSGFATTGGVGAGPSASTFVE